MVSPKIWEGPYTVTLSEQQYFVWDIACRTTKRQDFPEFFW